MTSERILYVDPWSGISGDMFLASLLDGDGGEGRLQRVLAETVAALGIAGVSVETSRAVEWGISCTRVDVTEGMARELRHLSQMEKIIMAATVPEVVRMRAIGAIRRLAEVEASIHGCGVEEIHFHEVGAVDTLVDVVGAFALVDALGVSRVAVGTIPVGGGTVEIAHGRMGVPAPATVRLLEGYQVKGGPEMRELTTPTGALIVGQLGATQSALPPMTIENIGYGAGTMKLEGGPNVLRTVIGAVAEDLSGAHGDRVVELETNLDDVSSEVVAYGCRVLREAGALDVWMEPAYMKKGRAGVVLHALVSPQQEDTIVTLLFQQTGTLGIRRQELSRYVANRGSVRVEVAHRPVRVKWGRWAHGLSSLAAEYDDAAAVATALGLPLKDVMELAVQEARRALGEEVPSS